MFIQSSLTPFALWIFLAMSTVSCKDLTGSPQLPSGVSNPSFYDTPAGALGMRNAAVIAVANTLPGFITDAGLLTDEAVDIAGAGGDALDARQLPEGVADPADQDYGNLQVVRTYATQAIGALAAYDTGTITQGDPVVLRGELYALEGYAEIMLADLFCSGIPLSTLNFQRDFTYHAADSTAQVYRDAIAKFDTALTLAGDSARVLNLARVGKGRAWMDLGQYDSASVAVMAVPNTFLYQIGAEWTASGPDYNVFNFESLNGAQATVADREGRNGLPFLTSGDPRTAVDTISLIDGSGNNPPEDSITFPVKYIVSLTDQSGFASVTLASGVEAQLIDAEVALHAGDVNTWLTTLNQLRTTAIIPGTTVPDPQALIPLVDPGVDSARISLLFAERAKWLFLTGERQGDLRRLVRNYHRDQSQVYPTGLFKNGVGTYGTDVTAPIPTAEDVNPLFHGCLNRHA